MAVPGVGLIVPVLRMLLARAVGQAVGRSVGRDAEAARMRAEPDEVIRRRSPSAST